MERFDVIAAEHRKLELTLDMLAILAAAPPNMIPLVRWRRLLEHEVARARHELWQHFRFEEENGYMREVSRVRPALTPQLIDLKEQHAIILGALDGVLGELTLAIDPTLPSRKILQVVRTIRRHEEQENCLCQQALTQELGAGD